MSIGPAGDLGGRHRDPVDPFQLARDRLAQRHDAGGRRVEGEAGVDGGLGRLGHVGGSPEVGLAGLQPDRAGHLEGHVGDLADPAVVGSQERGGKRRQRGRGHGPEVYRPA